jgi:hypothetical protein
MSNPQSHRSDETNTVNTAETDGSLSTAALVAGALRRIRAVPRALLALLLAGLVVTGIDWLRLHDPIPTVGYVGILDGRLSVLFGIPLLVGSRAIVPLSALVGLKPQWLAWGVGLELLSFVAVASAGAYALARLLQVSLTTAAVLRYAGLVALFQFGLGFRIEQAGLLLAFPLFTIWLFLLVRLFALPGLLVAGDSVGSAVRRSWRLATGHGWLLLAVVLLLGVLNHLLMSIPGIGPLGSAFVTVAHASTIATFLHTVNTEETTIETTTATE